MVLIYFDKSISLKTTVNVSLKNIASCFVYVDIMAQYCVCSFSPINLKLLLSIIKLIYTIEMSLLIKLLASDQNVEIE